jgi:hypothetical protein
MGFFALARRRPWRHGKNLAANAGPCGPQTQPMTSLNVTINVSPSPGFCIKSKLLQPGVLNVRPTHKQGQGRVPVPEGLKVFVNIAWSQDVPSPLDGVENAIEFVAHNPLTDSKVEAHSPISVFASDGRLDTDKGASGDSSMVQACTVRRSPI